MRGKEENKKRATEDEENRRRKYEDKQVRENKDRLIGLESCESLVFNVLRFCMDHINNFKVKELWVLLCYHFGSERFKGIRNKSELVEAATDLYRDY